MSRTSGRHRITVSTAYDESTILNIAATAARDGSLQSVRSALLPSAMLSRWLVAPPPLLGRLQSEAVARRSRRLPDGITHHSHSFGVGLARSALWRIGGGSHAVDGAFEVAFDRSVARALPTDNGGVLVGQPFSSRRSFEQARRLGMRTVLNHLNANLDTENDVIRAEAEHLGIRPRSLWPPWMIRIVDEEVEHADVVLVPSLAVEADLLRRGVPAEKLRLLRYGVDSTTFRIDDERPRSSAGLAVVSVGQVALRKGIHHLDAAIGLAGRTVASCTVVGPVTDHQLVKRAKHLHFVGPQDHVTVARTFRQADVFVFPSMAEGMARVVLEAMASGIPVITTKEAGYEGVIRSGENGFLVPARNPAAISDALATLAGEPELAASIGRAGRLTAEHFSWERHGRCFLDILDSHVDAARPGR